MREYQGKQAGARRRQSNADDTATADDAKLPVPSSNVHLERTFLALIMDQPDLIRQARGRIRDPRVFFREAHRQVYDLLCRIADRGGVPEVETLLDAAGDDTELISVISDLMTAGASLTPTQIQYREAILSDWAQQLGEHAAKRALCEVGSVAYGAAFSREDALTADLFAKLHEKQEAAWSLYSTADGGEDLFSLLTVDELEDMPPARGIIGDVLYEMTLAILYGASQRWKSFVALAWALCIAAGIPWLGKQTVQGDVVYVAAEGGTGIGPRVLAWRIKHGVSRDAIREHFHPLTIPVQLLDAEQVEKLVRTIQSACASPVLVVFDTLSRSMAGGDENAGKDGSRAIQAADRIRQALGCTVLLVAHPGKDDTRGIRGWSGYFAAADTVIRAHGGGDKPRLEPGEAVTLTCEKPKDTEPFDEITITTELVRLADRQGASLRPSLVVVHCDRPAKSEATHGLKDREYDALACVNEHGTGISFNDWSRETGIPAATLKRYKDKLQDLAYILKQGDNWHTTRKGARLFMPEQADTTIHFHSASTEAVGSTSTTSTTLRGGSGGSGTDSWEQPAADVAKWEGA